MNYFPKSTAYKLVNKDTQIIEAEGSARDMRKLRKQDPSKYDVYLSPSRNSVGKKMY